MYSVQFWLMLSLCFQGDPGKWPPAGVTEGELQGKKMVIIQTTNHINVSTESADLASRLLLPALHLSSSPSLSFLLVKLMSEPAYGFVLFDYITGNLQEQTDRSQLL